MSDPILLVYFTCLGLAVGSFLNVVIYRMPLGLSVWHPRSFCPTCKVPIPWYHNIPLASWLILRGRSACCHERISARYPIIEALTAVLTFVVAWQTPLSWTFARNLWLTWSLLAIVMIDWDHKIIPDEISLGGLVLALGYAFAPDGLGIVQALIGAAVGAGVLFGVGAIGSWVLKKDAMGGGDVKLLAQVGAFLGWKLALLTIFFSSFLGSIGGLIILRATRKGGVEREIPYGPFIAAAAWGLMLWGDALIRWYVLHIMHR